MSLACERVFSKKGEDQKWHHLSRLFYFKWTFWQLSATVTFPHVLQPILGQHSCYPLTLVGCVVEAKCGPFSPGSTQVPPFLFHLSKNNFRLKNQRCEQRRHSRFSRTDQAALFTCVCSSICLACLSVSNFKWQISVCDRNLPLWRLQPSHNSHRNHHRLSSRQILLFHFASPLALVSLLLLLVVVNGHSPHESPLSPLYTLRIFFHHSSFMCDPFRPWHLQATTAEINKITTAIFRCSHFICHCKETDNPRFFFLFFLMASCRPYLVCRSSP